MKRFDPDTFAILGVNTDTDREQYRTLRGELGVTWPSLWQGGRKGAYIDAWKPSAYPTTILVDADGIVRFRDLRGVGEVDRRIEELLADMEAHKAADETPR